MPDDNEGHVGYLTADQFDRFQWAMHNARKLIPWWRVAGYIRTGETNDRIQMSTERPLGLPPTWIAAEDLTRMMFEFNDWAELEDVANDNFGADLARQFTRDVETAGARWPFEDKPHRVRYMRCQACDAMTLRYYPPKGAGGRVTVKCSTKECRAVMDEDMFKFAAQLIESENNARRLGAGSRSGADDGQVEADDLPVGA